MLEWFDGELTVVWPAFLPLNLALSLTPSIAIQLPTRFCLEIEIILY